MANYRTGRVNEELMRALCEIIRTVKDPRVSTAFISIISVDCTPDLKNAKIKYSVMGERRKGDAQKGLKIRKNALVVVDKGVKTVEFEAGSGLTNKGHHELPGQGVTAGKFVDMTNGVRGVAAFTYVAADEDAGTKAKVTVALTSNNEAYVPNTDEEAAKIRLFWEDDASEEAQNATELVISPDRYPGTYRVVGDSLIRSEKTGKDEAFQFVINKAKMLSEVTLTMQAEGDPSTFNMTLNVLRDDEGNMMSLVKY
jgi:hypothetical protein